MPFYTFLYSVKGKNQLNCFDIFDRSRSLLLKGMKDAMTAYLSVWTKLIARSPGNMPRLS